MKHTVTDRSWYIASRQAIALGEYGELEKSDRRIYSDEIPMASTRKLSNRILEWRQGHLNIDRLAAYHAKKEIMFEDQIRHESQFKRAGV